jgi:hypothetical protein
MALAVVEGARSWQLRQQIVWVKTLAAMSRSAYAATYGAVDTLLVDIDEVVPGRVDETTGAVTFGQADDAVDGPGRATAYDMPVW